MKSNDPRAQADARRRQDEAVRQADEDFMAVASHPAGQRFLWNLMSRCHVFASTWSPSAQVHFNEGERNVGLYVLTSLNRLCPERYLEMVQRQAEDNKAAKRREAAGNPTDE
ncbi:MAG TPA: hypothetical protein VFZ38_10795 [Vicinamibacterales bacterium]